MFRQPTFTNIIHLRDFIDAITDDTTRENTPNYVEIQTDINIFEEGGFCSPNIIAEPIRTRIHAYLAGEERDLYIPNSFFYADGRFFTALSTDDTLEINIQALSLMRHPGAVDDFEEYRRHLPERWCPMVTIIGSVLSRNDNSLDPSELRHFTIETSVYNTSKAAPVQFSVVCFLENTNRWKKVKTPLLGTFLSISAKVAGRTADTNRLALRVLDLAYIPRTASAVVAPTPDATPPSNRSSRWSGRATPSTPSKRPRVLEPANDPAGPSEIDTTPPQPKRARHNLHTPHNTDSHSTPPPPSTIADAEESSLASVPSLTSDSATRPNRNRHLPKK